VQHGDPRQVDQLLDEVWLLIWSLDIGCVDDLALELSREPRRLLPTDELQRTLAALNPDVLLCGLVFDWVVGVVRRFLGSRLFVGIF
jgi:hypothetical protein